MVSDKLLAAGIKLKARVALMERYTKCRQDKIPLLKWLRKKLIQQFNPPYDFTLVRSHVGMSKCRMELKDSVITALSPAPSYCIFYRRRSRYNGRLISARKCTHIMFVTRAFKPLVYFGRVFFYLRCTMFVEELFVLAYGVAVLIFGC